MRYLEYPYEPDLADTGPRVFLFGPVDEEPAWQFPATVLLAEHGFTGTVLNPRPLLNPADRYGAWRPFGWQSRLMAGCDLVLFFRPAGPVHVLNTYQAHVADPGRPAVVVGCDRQDAAVHRIRAAAPWLTVHPTLADTVTAALTQLASRVGEAVSSARPV